MKFFTVSVLCTFLYNCHGYKILAVFPVPMRSHHMLNSKIVNELVNRGHEVTHITPYPQKNPATNLKEISVESAVGIIDEHKKHLYGLEQQSISEICGFLHSMGCILTKNVLESKEIQTILQSQEKYDVVLMPQYLNEGLLGIAHHLQAPLVLIATMPLFPWASFLLDHPSPPSYVPNLLGTYTGHMNFWERLSNSFYDLYTITYYRWMILPKHRELVKKYIPGAPDLYNFLNNGSVLLVNSHMSTYEALPQVPNTVEIGGLHIQEPKTLPEDLQRFLDESVDGVIVFSMGSNLKSADFSLEIREGILKAFSKLKQRVLWKWETDQLPGQPANVKLMKWLPQSDVLAHPNIKALINHGGLLSTMESVYYGVPVIGIPVFSDQKMNIATAVSRGYAIAVPFQELTEEKLSAALDKILKDAKYRVNSQKRSKLMRDRPIKPIDLAMYWIEYVVRHQGAPHLRYPGADLPWYQRNLLDVIAFVLVATFLLIFIMFIVFKRTVRHLCQVHQKYKKID